MLEQFSDNIRYYRKLNHLTQEQLAEKVNADKTMISLYEAGRVMPRSERIKSLAEALGVEAEALFAPRDKVNHYERIIAKCEAELATLEHFSNFPNDIKRYAEGKRDAITWCVEEIKKEVTNE